MATVLELEGVSKAFGSLVVIADFDLAIEEDFVEEIYKNVAANAKSIFATKTW